MSRHHFSSVGQKQPKAVVEVLERRCLLAGSGLSAIYFDHAAVAGTGEKDFTGTSVTRVEPQVNFSWGSGSPHPSIAPDFFTARFAGEVETPAGASGTYTFRTNSDDGVRLWVDDRLIINNWTSHGPTNDDGNIVLKGGKRYHIVLEYFEHHLGAVLSLQWKKPGDSGFTVIPTGNLHPDQRDFPASSSAGHLNVREPFTWNGNTYQAVGDGIADDTAALQAAINRVAYNQFVYLPNGTYRVTNSLILGNAQANAKYKVLQGQNRDNTVIRLDDAAAGFTSSASPKSLVNFWDSTGSTGQAFKNSIFDLTINTGANNPGAVALRYLQNNQGGLYDVTLRSEVGSDGKRQGVKALDLTAAWPGPGMVRNMLIEGFNLGIDIGHYQLSMNFEDLTMQGQNVKSIQNYQNVVNLLDFQARSPVPLYTDGGSRGRLTIINGEITTGGPTVAKAITQSGAVFLRNASFSGFTTLVDNSSGSDLTDPAVALIEYSNYGYGGAFANRASRSLNLPIKKMPEPDYDAPSNWVRVDPGTSSDDDTQRIRDAIAFANANGRKTVYFVGGNSYRITDTIDVSGGVTRLMGMDATLAPYGALYGGGNKPMFRFTGSGSTPVVFERFYGDYPNDTFTWIEDNSSRTVVLRNLLLRRTNAGQNFTDGIRTGSSKSGELFIEDASVPTFHFSGANTTVFARQLNPESQHKTNVIIDDATVSIFGFKIEGGFSGIEIRNNATAEVLGAMPYANVDPGTRPLYIINNSRAFILSRQNGDQSLYYDPEVRETRGTTTQNSTGQTWAYVGYSAATLGATRTTASGTYNLTGEGTSDWAKWGRSSVTDFDRKATGGSKIGNWTALNGGGVSRSYSSGVSHTWTDGSPNASATSNGYIRTGGAGKGFEFTVAATTATQSLRLYVATQYGETGRLELLLDDGSASPVVTTVTGGSGISEYIYTIDFAAASNTALRVRWTAVNSVGNVILRAAALS
jgi:hypothetical protein